MLKQPTGRWLITILAVAAALFAFTGFPAAFGPNEPVAAEVRRPGSPGHFKSGGERSVIILQEIAATLKKMDERLEHIEKAVLEIDKRDRGD